MNKPRYAFFGTAPLAIPTLNALHSAGFTPSLIITAPDRIEKKKTVIAPEKAWAQAQGIPTLEVSLFSADVIAQLDVTPWDFFVVAAYGKILPQTLLRMPRLGVINVHPSLLPKLRGPSPIRSALLQDMRTTGVSIMLLDEKMDHGPLLAQKTVAVAPWPQPGRKLDALLAEEGAQLLAEILPAFVADTLQPHEQDHAQATFCKMIKKDDALIDLAGNAYENLLKICAYDGWPGAFTYFVRNGAQIRVKIDAAHIDGNELVLDVVVPEGKPSMPYADFLRSGAVPA